MKRLIRWKLVAVIALTEAVVKGVYITCVTLLLLLDSSGVQAQSGVAPASSESDNVVRAAYNENSLGAALTLPDGSVIKTVWPAALAVIEVASPLHTQPVSPRCEPAVYSIARVLPDGKELWAKSYLFRGPIINVCDPDKWGFTVRSGMYEYGGVLGVDELIYLKPYDGTFFIGGIVNEFVLDKKPPKHGLHISADTGDIVGNIPANIRVVDAYRLREMKRSLEKKIESEIPKGTIDENGRKSTPKFFRRLEDLIFQAPK
ncbi:hypothetical protein [Variovorax terrae]|uniref:Uncharacterized protein n=1 Tax=Variovorax terrae TaxID=2923278 RepID=A0A9X1VWX6_9BURK|nr:hypothetical protein [Variovorax terrae]MCJ0762038.1 hypothetical protein [Variovorax terrae]